MGKQILFSLIIVLIIGVFTFSIAPSSFAQEEDLVPDWIRWPMEWWISGEISDEEFMESLGYLIDEGILNVSLDIQSSTSSEIPSWVRHTGEWWVVGEISDAEFLAAIEFLVNVGIIPISIDTPSHPDTPPQEQPVPPVTIADTDDDGILNDVDQCITQKEVFNGWEDADGCPDETPTRSQNVRDLIRSANSGGDNSGTSSPSSTKFQNDSIYYIISLWIDGIEHIPHEMGFAPDSYLIIDLEPGSHTMSAVGGWWENGEPRSYYPAATGTFTQVEGVTGQVNIADVTIGQILSQYQTVGSWDAMVFDNDLNFHILCYTFYPNGQYNYKFNGEVINSGSVTQTDRNLVSTKFTTSQGLATLSEIGFYFTMYNDPFTPGQIVQYQYQGAYPCAS